jgi:hypothetical protein
MSASARPKWRCAPPSRRAGRQAGRGGRADDAARAPALQDLFERFKGLPFMWRPGLAPGRLAGVSPQVKEGPDGRHGRHRRRHPRAARQGDQVQAISASSSSTRSSTSASSHKERLKELKRDVHVLTLTATPIPRTLAAGADRRARAFAHHDAAGRPACGAHLHLALRSLVVREALLRERYRGGQSFYVCPRIADLDEAARLPARTRCRRLKFAVAHGQMAPASSKTS